MTIPAILFATLIALLYGAVYHFFRGGGFWRLLLYLGLSVVGFVLGHLVGLWRGWDFLLTGSLYLGTATLGSLIILVIGDWLSHFETDRESRV
jgi:hypothetical protein